MITLVSGTNRPGSNTAKVARAYGNVLSAIKEKKTIDDALKSDLNAALKEFQTHYKSMKATAAR